MKDNSLESVFNAYFNNKKNFSDFYTLKTEDETSLIPLHKSKGSYTSVPTSLKLYILFFLCLFSTKCL